MAKTRKRRKSGKARGRGKSAATVFVALPLAAVLFAGLSGPLARVLGEAVLWRAAGRSLAVALSAGFLSLLIGWTILLTSRELRMRRRPRGAEAVEWVPGFTWS